MVVFHCICLSVVLIDSVFKMHKNYYVEVFLGECKYVIKGEEVTRHITYLHNLHIFCNLNESDKE